MKLEVGMYIRTINGIQKFIKETDDVYAFDKGVIIKPDNVEKYVIKASHNIIDLIEVGDLIVGIDGHKFEVYAVGSDCVYINELKEFILINEIKDILTKEQIENNCYKRGDQI